MDIANFLRIVFWYTTSGGCFWQSYHGTVKPAGVHVPVLWFCATACFRYWSKTFMKRWWNNSFTWQINFSFAWFNWSRAFDFRIGFWWKTYTKRCTSNTCNVMCQKTFFPCTLRLVRYFQFPGMIWKTEYGSENSDFDFVSLLRSLRSFTWASCGCFSPAQIWYREIFVNLLSFFSSLQLYLFILSSLHLYCLLVQLLLSFVFSPSLITIFFYFLLVFFFFYCILFSSILLIYFALLLCYLLILFFL